MIIINPSYEIISCPDGHKVLKQIEKIARTCYKSENKIKEDSHTEIVKHLLNNNHHAMLEFGGDIVVKFISNRGFSHEIVRHRLCSFAQESTRYCNYSKNKFNNEITIISLNEDLLKISNCDLIDDAYEIMYTTYKTSEINYMKMINMGIPAEIAREILPIGIKTEINVKANIREWRHIFSLRCSKKAHPRMRELMIPLLHDLSSRIPILFNDLVDKYNM